MITGRRGCGGDEVRQSLRGKVEVEGKISSGGSRGSVGSKREEVCVKEVRRKIKKKRIL